MDHESTRLTEEERRTLAEIEHGLAGHRRGRLLFLRRRARRPRRRGRSRGVWWAVAALGSAVLAGGLWVDAVWAAAAGFVAVMAALSVITADITPTRGLARLRRLIALDDQGPPRDPR